MQTATLSEKLPTRYELPDSLDIPVDNELQDLTPHLLKDILSNYWNTRDDWFFGVDMGIYYNLAGHPPTVPIIPDGFLSVGVARRPYADGRLSYILWEEDYVAPKLVLECVSQTYGNEYGRKMKSYTQLGVLYYVIHNPTYSRRDQHDPLEVYRLTRGKYKRCSGKPVWMPELELAIGRDVGTYQKWRREWLYWYDSQGTRLPSSEELAHQAMQQVWQQQLRAKHAETLLEQEQNRADQAERRIQQLEKLLREKGIDWK